VKHCLLTFTATAALSGSLAASLQRSRQEKSEMHQKSWKNFKNYFAPVI